ncbi:Uncharacterized protein QJS10_CPA10g00907 [Acorus calamus]|uniref:O-fucosyltransferase family protein n=1 Tax=Acorus calamus TaxID=4465 RepID=A0AAV9E1R5_ACOCL|nr:Uncharacterized protein QJS10_CPA10g00907 [Acorus calamus]
MASAKRRWDLTMGRQSPVGRMSSSRRYFLIAVMLFFFGCLSIYTGKIVTDRHWCSRRLGKRAWLISGRGWRVPEDAWRSRSADLYYGCSGRDPRFLRKKYNEEEYQTNFTARATLKEINKHSFVTVVQLTKFDFRLANNLDEDLQKLRCHVNYHALRFTRSIQELGQKVVEKMREMSPRFIAVHLRFEPDMLAFSGCYYGGGDKERRELGAIRDRWKTLPDIDADGERSRGKCPLTPHEVGLMLRGLGFGNDSYLYIASGEIYGGNETLQPLRDLFPNMYTKEMLAEIELEPFRSHSSRLAAIDYIVCDESDVFVTNNNGNMARVLAGQRRYMGHKRTIRPNSKKLSSLFKARNQMNWETFSRKVKFHQRGFMGEPEEMRPGRGEFHEFPYACICRKPTNDSSTGAILNIVDEPKIMGLKWGC